MKRSPSRQGGRRAGIAPLTAFLLIPLLGLTAFAVDMGWIVLAQSDLQNAADSAALAGAGQLMNGFVQYNLPNQTNNQPSILSTAESAAKSSAKQYAGLNAAGGVSSLTLLDSDVEFGFTDASGNYTKSTSSSGYPNTVKVTMRRDATANTSLGLFFAPVLGISTTDLKATASATIYAATVDSFKNTPNLDIRVLPMTYDVSNWQYFLTNGMPPGGTTVSRDANGNPTVQTYPSLKDTGNFGMFSLIDSTTGASTISNWIADGMNQSDLQSLQSASAGDQTPLLPLSQHNQNILPSQSTDGMGSWNWSGNPGLKTSDVHTLSNYVGDTYLLPLFKALDPSDANYTPGLGQGSNYYFNTVQFVGVRVVSTANSTVVLQPSPMVLNPDTVILTSVIPAGATSGGVSTTNATTFAPPKLTQ